MSNLTVDELSATPDGGVIPVDLSSELKSSYLSYSMSVIVSRAIPDVRDGMKYVQRRILYSMHNNGFLHDKPYKKSSRIVGDVMGKYHPHGDSSIYDALVRMAQPFSLLMPVIDGQGNFGSVDGDSPAAMRYTEARLAYISKYILEDIYENTVDFRPNYDGLEKEPVILPSRLPYILLNGASGVAVGMATNIPTHNLSELIAACCAYISNPEITVDELLDIISGPDFPTGGIIIGKSGIRSAYETGRGSILISAKTHFETIGNRQAIIVDELPYQVNKSKLLENIADLVRDKKIDGISDLRDESDQSGIRVVIELKLSAIADVILNQLMKFTQLRVSFGINMVMLKDLRPTLMTLKDILSSFVAHRKEVILRRTQFRLEKFKERANVLVALYVAVLNIDAIVKLIKSAKDNKEAIMNLLAQQWQVDDDLAKIIETVSGIKIDKNFYYLSEFQAQAILEMRLSRLTNIEKGKLQNDLADLINKINDCVILLSSQERLIEVILSELDEIKNDFDVPRKTLIVNGADSDIDEESLIPKENIVITVSNAGYIKTVKLSFYKSQKRGGKGKIGQDIKEEDFVTQVYVATTHTEVLFFSNKGRVYKLKAYKLPSGDPGARGRALVNILQLDVNEFITSVMMLPDDSVNEDLNIVFATMHGKVRRNLLSDFKYVPANGKLAIILGENDCLISVKTCTASQDLLLSTYLGKTIRFPLEDIRLFKGRNSEGVNGINMVEGDKIVSVSLLNNSVLEYDLRVEYLKINVKERFAFINNEDIYSNLQTSITKDDLRNYIDKEQFILTVTENGYGKISSSYEYRQTSRGGSGIINIITSKRNGNVVASFAVGMDSHLMLITNKGQMIRISVNDISILSRNTQGVNLFKIKEGEKVVSVAEVMNEEEVQNKSNDEEEVQNKSNDEDNLQNNTDII